MTYQTLKGQTYSVTSKTGTVITSTVGDTTFTLLTLDANKQGAFTAISDEVTSTDEKAVIFPFVDSTSSAGVASALSQSGSGIEYTHALFTIYKRGTQLMAGSTIKRYQPVTLDALFDLIGDGMFSDLANEGIAAYILEGNLINQASGTPDSGRLSILLVAPDGGIRDYYWGELEPVLQAAYSDPEIKVVIKYF